jgi:hypothetical protein
MSHRSLASSAALAAVIVVLLSAQAPVVGQVRLPATKAATTAKASKPPRTLDGRPDLQGIWSNGTLTPLERPKSLGAKEFYTDQEFAELAKRARRGDVGQEGNLGVAAPEANPLRYDLSLYGFDLTKSTFASNKRTSLIVGPDGVVPPTLSEARKRNADRAAKNKGHEFDGPKNRPLSERCILMNQVRLPMLPAVNDNNPLQIVQGLGYVGMLHEMDHSTRVIPTDGRPHIPQSIRQLQGDSVGHWEGDTLVVDTANFTDLTAFRGSGEKLHLVERFTRVSEDIITYQFTVEDPTTWDKPWTVEVPMTKTQGPVYEFTCHEGNSEIATILRGARVAEEDAAASKAAK